MYNPELKNRFIRDYTTSKHTIASCESLFLYTEKYENRWKSDLCTRSEDELTPMLEGAVGVRNSSNSYRVMLLRSYVRWCIQNNVPDVKDDLLKIEPSGIDKVKKTMIVSSKHLQFKMDQIFDPEKLETIGNVYRCFLWLAFSGIKECDSFNIKTDDVNLEDMVVGYDNQEYPFPREALESIRNCARLNDFNYIHPCYAKTIRRDRVPGNVLLRGIKSTLTANSIMSHICRAEKEKGLSDTIRLAYNDVRLSGIFCRIYENEEIGISPNFRAIAIDEYGDGVYSKKEKAKRAKINVTTSRIENDYIRWKLAFK